MSKSAALMLVLVFLVALCVAVVPAFSSEPIKENVWVSKASMHVARSFLGVAVVNGKIYAIGGFTGTHDMFWNIDITRYATVEQYTPFGYGTVPPNVDVVSPETNGTYLSGNVSLVFAVNRPASWIRYSLDGQGNITVNGNVTLSGLTSGLHNVTVYVRDEFENVGLSKTISFTVAESFPTVPVAAASVAVVASVSAGILVYFKKRRH